MIEKLEHLTIAQFIDLVCGNTGVLLGKHEFVSPSRLGLTVRNIVFEYKSIADASSAKSYLSRIEEMIRAKMEVILFTMCKNLSILGRYDHVREILREYGVHTDKMTDERVSAEITSRLERAKLTVKEIEEGQHNENSDTSHIRMEFDGQMAALMAHFKFQIEPTTMKATLYAHLVARYNREIKAKIAAMKKR